MAAVAASLTSTKSGVTVSSGLKVALEQTAITTSGPRFVKVKVQDGELVKVSHGSGVRTANWKQDFNNVSKSLEQDEPCFIVFFAPGRTESRGGARLDKQVFLGHGHRKGGLAGFVTGPGSPPMSPHMSPKGRTKDRAKAWEAPRQQSRSPARSVHEKNRTILMFHCPETASGSDKMVYSTSKSALVLELDNPEMYHGATFKEFEYSTYKKTYDTKGPLSPWERQAIIDEQEAEKIRKEGKIGGFLADMHQDGGVMGVATVGGADVARELNEKIGSPVASRRQLPADYESKTGPKSPGFGDKVRKFDEASSPNRSPGASARFPKITRTPKSTTRAPRIPKDPTKSARVPKDPTKPTRVKKATSRAPKDPTKKTTKETRPSVDVTVSGSGYQPRGDGTFSFSSPEDTPEAITKPKPKAGYSKPKPKPKAASPASPESASGASSPDTPFTLEEWLDDLGLESAFGGLSAGGIKSIADLKGITSEKLASMGVEKEKDRSKIIRHSKAMLSR